MRDDEVTASDHAWGDDNVPYKEDFDDGESGGSNNFDIGILCYRSQARVLCQWLEDDDAN